MDPIFEYMNTLISCSLQRIGNEGTHKLEFLKIYIYIYSGDSAACTVGVTKDKFFTFSFCGHLGNKRHHSNYFYELRRNRDVNGCFKKPT